MKTVTLILVINAVCAERATKGFSAVCGENNVVM